MISTPQFGLGVAARDIRVLRRDAAYRALFKTLYCPGDPGVEGDDVFMLRESLPDAGPSGEDGWSNQS